MNDGLTHLGLRELNRWYDAHDNVEEALHITQLDRNEQNGDPEDNFHHIALCWSALLQARGLLAHDEFLSAADVARMMVTLKMCRDSHTPHQDNRVDGHGYILCLDRVEPVNPSTMDREAVDTYE